MRKLAREAVIFCFLGALIAGVLGLVIERGKILAEMGKPCAVIHAPGDVLDGAISAGPCNMDGKLIPQLTGSMCIGDLIDGKCTKLSAEGEAAEAKAKAESIRVSWKDVPRLLGTLAIFAFVFGFPGGLVVWSVYRLARFAITG
jgi:hypothetical protein